MSDNNDKKPGSPSMNWPGQNPPHSDRPTGQPVGRQMEDPLAELDRIVSQDFRQNPDQSGPSGVVSNDDLRLLEEELLRELRGAQEDASRGFRQPAAPVEPVPAEAAPVAPVEHVSMNRPHPLAPPQSEAAVPSAPVPSVEAAPDLHAYRTPESTVQEGVEGLRGFGQQPAAPEVSVPPVAAMPSAVSNPESPKAAPSLDDWSSLIHGTAPETSQSEPVASSYGRLPGGSQPGYLREDPVATSGSYGQLKRQAGTEAADPMHGFSPDTLSAPERDAPQPYSAQEGLAWHEQIAAHEAAQDAGYGAPASEPAAYDTGRAVPDVTAAPVASDMSSDPYAAFNQAQPDPYAAQNDPYAGMGASAPDVDVTGQGGYFPSADHYPYDRSAEQGRSDPAYPAYDTGYPQQDTGGGFDDALSSGYPMASGPHGTYADPGVAQAAAESAPYLQDEDYPTFDTEEYDVEPVARKSRKGLVAALAAVGVIVVGGLAVWAFGLGGDGGETETPVLAANTDPVKEAPEDPGGKVIPNQNKTVYNRIDGTETDEAPSELMPATEEPLALTPDGQAPRVISLSGGEANVAQSNGAETGGAVAPKKVRTVIVRPDGTIVSSNDENAGQSDVASVDKQMLQTTPSEQAMTQTFNNGIQDATAAATDQATAPLPREKPAELVALQSAAQNSAPAPANTQPTVLAPSASQPAVSPAPAAAAGGYTVQVTSQRTPEQARASYANIQSQLFSVLGGYQPDIKEANLGDRGIYYRVRVGSFADRAGAINFCNSIKAAGGDCLVARK